MNRAKENTWRITQGKQPVKQMKDVVAELQHYIDTYSDQPTYEQFSDETFIDDMLYGLGKSLGEEYQFATGFTDFKERILRHILQDPYCKDQNKQGNYE